MVRNTLESKPLAPLTLSHVSILCVTYGKQGTAWVEFFAAWPKGGHPSLWKTGFYHKVNYCVYHLLINSLPGLRWWLCNRVG